MIALKTALGHTMDLQAKNIDFLFIEKDLSSIAHLQELIRGQPIPPAWQVKCLHGTFAERFDELLPSITRTSRANSPIFVMVDPFGFSGTPFHFMKALGRIPRAEVLVSLMTESINRFQSLDQLSENFDDLFGCTDWRDCPTSAPPEARWRYFQDLYRRQLEAAGFQFVRSFEMRDAGNRIEYFLMHGTHSEKGLKVMKEAMWAVDAAGGTRFTDATDPLQRTLLVPEPDRELLRSLIQARFAGKAADVEEIESFVLIETAFRETHYKQILRQLETRGEIKAESATGARRKGTFPKGTKVTFIA